MGTDLTLNVGIVTKSGHISGECPHLYHSIGYERDADGAVTYNYKFTGAGVPPNFDATVQEG